MLRCCREQSLSSVPSDSLALFVSRFCAALPYASSASHSRAKIKLIHLYTIHLYTQEPELATGSVFTQATSVRVQRDSGGRVKQHPIANPNRHSGEAFGVRTTWGWVQ